MGKTDAVTLRAWEALSKVQDPELHYDIVNLGLVYALDVQEGVARVHMTLTSPSCPYGPFLMHDVRYRLEQTEGISKVELELVWSPPWSPQMMSDDAKLDLGFDV